MHGIETVGINDFRKHIERLLKARRYISLVNVGRQHAEDHNKQKLAIRRAFLGTCGVQIGVG
jgi:hypothetical protein